MSDTVKEVLSTSWFARIKNAVAGAVVGLILTVVTVMGLSWNEKRAVDVRRALNEGMKLVVSVAAEKVDPANEGALVHFSGRAESPDRVEDPDFGISEAALKLRRTVETYQWKEVKSEETRTKAGGSAETVVTYRYEKGWEDKLIPSENFKEPAGHGNPANKLYPDYGEVAEPILVGAYRMPDVLVGMITGWTALEVSLLDSLPGEVRERAQLAGEWIYFGADPAKPVVGDTRVLLEVVPPQEVSVVARQVGLSLEPHLAKSGARVVLLEPGIKSAEEMFALAQAKNRLTTWFLRVLFTALMGLGFLILLYPLRVVADVVPLVGRLAGAGMGFVAFLLAAVISTVTVAVAWLAVRPGLAIPLLVVAAGVAVWLVVRVRKAEQPPPLPAMVKG